MTSTLKINTIEPEGATTTLTVGESGQNTVIAGAGIKANVAKDAGGNALFTSDGSGNLSGLNSGLGSAMVLISTQTASDSASLSFTSGIDSTYNEYLFEFFNINPATDDVDFGFQASIDGGSNYNVTMTTTAFVAYHKENDTGAALNYEPSADQAQGTGYQTISFDQGSGADESTAGELHLFNPSSTTYVKNWYAQTVGYAQSDMLQDFFTGGYFNTTSALNAISFKMDSGNFDGTIKMFGIK